MWTFPDCPFSLLSRVYLFSLQWLQEDLGVAQGPEGQNGWAPVERQLWASGNPVGVDLVEEARLYQAKSTPWEIDQEEGLPCRLVLAGCQWTLACSDTPDLLEIFAHPTLSWGWSWLRWSQLQSTLQDFRAESATPSWAGRTADARLGMRMAEEPEIGSISSLRPEMPVSSHQLRDVNISVTSF